MCFERLPKNLLGPLRPRRVELVDPELDCASHDNHGLLGRRAGPKAELAGAAAPDAANARSETSASKGSILHPGDLPRLD